MIVLTTQEAAKRCGLSASFLHKSRVRGDGPPFLKVGRRAVRYDAAKLEAWLAEHERRSTSEQPPKPVAPTRRRKAGKAKPQLQQLAEVHHASPK
jgi:predicted DNA-binding transcriptional regulator AlpA